MLAHSYSNRYCVWIRTKTPICPSLFVLTSSSIIVSNFFWVGTKEQCAPASFTRTADALLPRYLIKV